MAKTDRQVGGSTGLVLTNTMNATTIPFEDVFRKTIIADDSKSITFMGKEGATWKQQTQWLEEIYGQNGKDRHWKWRGYGKEGTDTFKIILVRQACASWICECEEDECESEEDCISSPSDTSGGFDVRTFFGKCS